MFFIDIAVPRNVDPSVHKIDNVYVYNVDDLERHVAEGMKSRAGEVVKAEAIVDEELLEFRRWSRALQVQPTVVSLRARTRAVLTSELERTLGTRLRHLGEGDRAALAQMIDSATNKLLHAPTNAHQGERGRRRRPLHRAGVGAALPLRSARAASRREHSAAASVARSRVHVVSIGSAGRGRPAQARLDLPRDALERLSATSGATRLGRASALG